MKKTTIYLNKIWLIGLFILINSNILAQNNPFNCDYNAYLFQYNDVYSIDLASGNSYLVATDVTPGNINAAAYNPADGYIWGYLNSPDKTIVRIGQDFATTTYYIPELTSGNKYVGDIDSNGIYFLKAGGATYYKVDLNPSSPNYGLYISTESLSQGISVHDWAFNANDGYLYTVEQNSNILYRIDSSNGSVIPLGEVPILSGLSYTYGAVYFDASGNFYVSANQTGTIYMIKNVQNLTGSNGMTSNLFAFGPSSSSNDGARCPTAPVPQEDCVNGIDDDGDGLVDCDDPSCSGYASCPVIQAPVSGGNNGGLESNNRLAEQINKRNFNRTRNNYKFNSEKARKVTRTASYGNKNPNNFQLADFIPLGTIFEDEVIESTPTDLLAITNATAVYSVDYIKNNKSIASILALKTDEGVYEHTKYICDRLLGAQLLSVSTIEINGQTFIKSIIKNTDGSMEFVLSFSAKVVNNETNFAIESHWNLDSYEDNVTFYNFQIWTNSLDDLYGLGGEVLNLVNTQKTISDFNNSLPPTVYVRKGKYNNGSLDLQVVNTNRTQNVTFDAGLRVTETSASSTLTSQINLAGNYITNLQLATGNLFDVGFRLGDGVAIPDDLFMSDGPWGVDDAGTNTTVMNYAILPNSTLFDIDEFPIERNVVLSANTSDYIAVYRALTPRFKAVDLSEYQSFKLKAKGTGTLEIRFVKESITNWEEQYETSIVLTSTLKDYAIPFSAFTTTDGSELILDDVKTIVFTMKSENGTVVTKEMTLEAIRFSKDFIETFDSSDLETISVQPNPMLTNTSLHFITLQEESVVLYVYNQLGEIVEQINFDAVNGRNEIMMNRGKLSTGLYFCKIVSPNHDYKAIKLLVK
ncbi:MULTISPECIES: DUF6923 family protein [Flavobacterium]|uniref:DUF6923 family protein n=1 Tax=Flavobacterium jumunjinense TaxID=998845 RepID=A0ABV5GSX5_9FLAO|nr:MULTISPECIES: T9SS type A sorting domain-containing protein [Flavobacterium]